MLVVVNKFTKMEKTICDFYSLLPFCLLKETHEAGRNFL
jgi:hypothetical protein